MEVYVTFYNTVNEALAAVSENKNGLEIIAAQCVTCKEDLQEYVDERPDMPVHFMDIRIRKESPVKGGDGYEYRHETLYELAAWLQDYGIHMEQYIITCDEMDNGRHEYHILATLTLCAGYNTFDPKNLKDLLNGALCNEYAMDLVSEFSVLVECPTVVVPLSFYKDLVHRDAPVSNPMCDPLVLPYRDIILSNLRDRLFTNVPHGKTSAKA